ncbi:MerR family DNA-binding transcriptional regulator [Tatumella citrea]|uniref:HTH merR-type domain-containing protein n=1 Tax=Tatumella citrea TaxID=53336 RepID=A0A1Y0LJ07_TATCI|nr:MerR family DNA-binding transcriptional regulator [Tatumella citrea]ARU93737.1 hypothetical protein A7K98_08080 [Tatumella citrea]ARU97775.1 hypothetical protein A7K99_08080 [Tatumella citrea]
MQIGKLATLTGISIRMLRYYEQQGLLRPERTPAGYRRYSISDINTVKQIELLNRAGLTLNTISHLTDCLGSTPEPVQLCSALTDKIRQQLTLVDEQIDMLNQSRQLLVRLSELNKAEPTAVSR